MLAESEIVSAAREAGFRIITNEETVTLMRVARVVEAAAYAKAAEECEHVMRTKDFGEDYTDGCDDCIAAIRALAQAKDAEAR